MKLTARDVAKLIDISAVQAPHGAAEIRALVDNAREFHFMAVHVLPCWVTFLKELLSDSPDILIGAPVGFPSGAHRTEIKVAEARLLLQDGVQEMDMMLNVGKLRSGEYRYCEEEIRAVVQTAAEVPVKVILEVHYLSRDQLKKACEMCIKAGAAFVKTATGWAASGATLDVVQFITSFVGSAIKVKAAGSIRNLETLVKMHRMGVSRFGINLNSSMEIVRSVAALPGGVVEV
ncbi:MAG TPA: deoxyribose-phosphate aldolase [Spirochaetia bacterium]|nr:deoxyribose-phosphate aldolase [Spirochaetia bacterium]